MARKQSEIRKEVKQRGESILRSRIFRQIMEQKHHNGTVGAHSIGVAEDSLKIADALEKIGIRSDRDSLVKASLCHDLGMLDRRKKYKSQLETLVKHPQDGIKNTKENFPDVTKTEEDCIRHHMWPISPLPPHTLEGLIVCFADKKSACREMFRGRSRSIDPEYLKERPATGGQKDAMQKK